MQSPESVRLRSPISPLVSFRARQSDDEGISVSPAAKKLPVIEEGVEMGLGYVIGY